MKVESYIEREAIGKLAERLLSFQALSYRDFSWATRVYQLDIETILPSFELSRLDDLVEMENLFDSLVTVYETRSAVFPLVLGLLLGRAIRLREQAYMGTSDSLSRMVDGHISDIQRYLDALGLFVELKRPSKFGETFDVRVVSRDLTGAIQSERVRVHSVLEERYPQQFEALMGAYRRHLEGGPDAYRQSLDSCRNLLENLLKTLAGTPQWKPKLNEVAKSSTLGRLIPHIYDFLSGTGTHSPRNRTREDSLLGIRLTEGLLSHLLLEGEVVEFSTREDSD